jgi:hypothetical protein
VITSRPCWTVSDVNYALPFEAGAVPDELFRVAHVPGLITRYRFRGHGSGRSEGEPVNEDQVLNDLLHGEAAMRVLAITGQYGTGKSHLVRWLHIELNRRRRQSSDLEHMHVVYVPKRRTTLRQVVDRILDQQHGPRFEEFRQRLQRAQDSFNRETAPDRLVDELANSIRDLSHDDLAKSDPYRALLIEELPTLIQDPVYREALLEDGSVIRRTIDNALERSTASEDGPPRFIDADLHLELADLTDMSPKAKDTFSRLANTRFRAPALALMNEQIDRAVGALFDVRRGEVGELLLDVRAELQQQDRELVLLIEDFTLLQGVERELLEAVIAPVQEVGGPRLCPVRAAFAVTTGHFELMGTVISRIDADGGYRYSLDAQFNGDGPTATLDDAVTLVGSYLNAARLGRKRIESWSRDHLDDSSHPPNACHECVLIEDCHRGFGESSLGHGLYPFNTAALARVLHGQGATTFEPREVLKHVRDTLRDERAAIERGKFPTPSWARRHNPAITPMAKAVLDELGAFHKTEDKAEQAEHLLMFWAGVTDQLVNLDPDVHEAFGVPAVDGAPTIDQVRDKPAPEPTGDGKPPLPPPPPPPPDPLEAEEAAIAGWRTALRTATSRERELPVPLARDLRQQFAEFALERAALGLTFLSYDPETTTSLTSGIHIDGAAGGNPRSDAAVVVRLDADDEALFLALRKLRHGRSPSTEDLVAITEGIDAHLDEVVGWVARHRASHERLIEAIQLLYLAAAATNGHLGVDMSASDHEVMSALFTAPHVALATTSLPRRRAFEAALLEPAAIREATEIVERALSVRQNVARGGPSGIDAAAVLACIDDFRRSDLDARVSRARTGYGAALTQARAALDPVLEEGLTVLKTTLDRVEDLLDQDTDAGTVAEECRLTVDALMNANAFAGDATRIRNAANAFAAIDLHHLRESAAAAVDNAHSRDETLRLLSRVPWKDVEVLASFLTLTDEAFAASAERLESATGEGFDTLGQLTAARTGGTQLADALDRFADDEGKAEE